MTLLNILIVGRSNVGKSTLFNHLINKRNSITDNLPGTTRDFNWADLYFGNFLVRLFDTAGFDIIEKKHLFRNEIQLANEKLFSKANLLLFVVDSKVGLTNNDLEFSEYLRKFHVKTFLISNKHDNKGVIDNFWEPLSLGIEDSIPVSAVHGHGIDHLIQKMIEYFNSKSPQINSYDNFFVNKSKSYKKNKSDPYSSQIILSSNEVDKNPVKLGIVGRPNVGKSTLLNSILKEKRALTSEKSGTTTDPVLVDIIWFGYPFKIADTAGIRRSGKISKGLEKFSVQKAIEVIKFSEVVLMVLDYETAFDSQDLKIINHIENEGRCLVLALNKWDQEKNKKEKLSKLKNKIKKSLPQFGEISLIAISALKNQGMEKIKKAVLRAKYNWETRLPTARLNNWLELKINAHPPPMINGRRIKLRYITQVKARPPTFIIFSSRLDLPGSYRRYLINSIRENFELSNVPIRLDFRTGNNPYLKT